MRHGGWGHRRPGQGGTSGSSCESCRKCVHAELEEAVNIAVKAVEMSEDLKLENEQDEEEER